MNNFDQIKTSLSRAAAWLQTEMNISDQEMYKLLMMEAETIQRTKIKKDLGSWSKLYVLSAEKKTSRGTLSQILGLVNADDQDTAVALGEDRFGELLGRNVKVTAALYFRSGSPSDHPAVLD